jgi:ankyrin repeat protein
MSITPIRPPELDNPALKRFHEVALEDVWRTTAAVLQNDIVAFRSLLEASPGIATEEYWFPHPLHFAVREGHMEMVRLLLDMGAPAQYKHWDDLATVARDRGHTDIADLLTARLSQINMSDQRNALHQAVTTNDLAVLKDAIKANPDSLNDGDDQGLTPLHLAAQTDSIDSVALLLDAGASLDTRAAWLYEGFQPIDMALWRNSYWDRREQGSVVAGYMLASGAPDDMVIASALGDLSRVRSLLSDTPDIVNIPRPSGKRALSAAVQSRQKDLVRLLLDAGADPSLPEGRNCPHGHALWAAAHSGQYAITEMLLEKGADPNGSVESCGSPTTTEDPAIRKLMYRYGGRLHPLDYAYSGDLDALNACPQDELIAANAGQEGGLYKVAFRMGDWDMLHLIMARDVPFPTVFNYDLPADHPDMSRFLLEKGLNPNISNWQRCTTLHAVAGHIGQEKRQGQWLEALDLFLSFGADINSMDEEYRSTPLGWAARCGIEEMIEPLLERGADPTMAGAPWATPLEWAKCRGHHEISEILKARVE